MKDHRRLLSGLLAAVMVMSQSASVLAAESVNAVPAADQAVATDSLEAYGFPGGYELDEKDMELKMDMAANGMVGTLEGSEEGRNYREGKIWFLADDREDAEAIAGSYGATLINFSYGVGTAELNGGKTVLDAVTAAADTGSQLPPVEPVYISEIEPDVETDGNDDLDASGASVTVEPALTWKDYLVGNNSKEDDSAYQDPILDNPDPLLTDPSNLEDSKTQYQYQHDQVNTWEAWGSSIGSPDVKVAVVDTGVFADHEDFIDPSGKSIVVKAVDVTKSKAGEVTGEHGTHVAGIIGALVNNGKGGAGIAPGVSIYSYNVCYCYEGRMDGDDIARGISAAMGKDESGKMVEEPADIINMSLGSTNYSASECALIKQAYEDGICVYASAGNNFTNVRCYPAAYTSTKDTGIVSVGSTDYNGKRADYSNFGSWVTVCAPGTNIRSTVPYFKGKDNKDAYKHTRPTSTGEEIYHVLPVDTISNNCYETMSGTSMAAPVVTGVAALYLSAYGPSLGGSKVLVGRDLPKKMKELLLSGGTEVKDLGKRVNAGAMFSKESKTPAIIALDDEYNQVPKDKPNKNIYRDVYYVVFSSKASLSNNRIKTSSVKYNTWYKEKIYYTVDGDEPKVDPETLTVTSGTLYDPAKPLFIANFKPGSKHTIRALAVTSAKKVTGVSSITVYAPEIQKKTMSPTVKKIDLFAESTADAKKDRNKGKKSVIYFSDSIFAPYSATATGSAGDELQAASSSLFFDQIKPTLTFTNGTVAGVGDFTEDQLDCMIWGSNNGSVLTVIPNPDGSCIVVPVKKGNCKVNLWVYSNGKVQKSKDISVTVKQAIDEINIKGLSSIDPGSGSKTITTTYKAECLPKEASEKKVLWHLIGGDALSSAGEAVGVSSAQKINIGGGTVEINEKNGKLKMTGVRVNPSYPDSFAVVAVSADTQLVREYKEVVIGNKTDESLKIGLNESELTYYQKFVEKKKDRVVYNKKNTCLKSFVVASADFPAEGNDNCVTLYSTDGVPVDWSSSDKNIARVDALPGSLSANVYGMKSGSATIRCKAADGSGKSVSITVNVKNPVSGLEVGEDNFTDFYTLAVGKTVTPPSYVGKTYGTPSNSTLTWGFSAGYVKADREKGKVVLQDVDEDLTAALHGSSSGVSVNEKTGKLTINKSKWSSAYNDRVYIRVYAYTTDGTEYSDYTNYVITTPVTGIKVTDGNGVPVNKGGVLEVSESGYGYSLRVILEGQGSNNENLQFGRASITSSSSECGGAAIIDRIAYDKGLGAFYMDIRAVGGEKNGTATIKIKALDGSGKTTSFKIKTKNSVKITKW